jgi:hypothetical protein
MCDLWERLRMDRSATEIGASQAQEAKPRQGSGRRVAQPRHTEKKGSLSRERGGGGPICVVLPRQLLKYVWVWYNKFVLLLVRLNNWISRVSILSIGRMTDLFIFLQVKNKPWHPWVYSWDQHRPPLTHLQEVRTSTQKGAMFLQCLWRRKLKV